MNALFRAEQSARRHRFGLSVTMLEERNLMATTAGALPPVNLSAAEISSLGQSLANFAKHFDGSNAVADLTNVENAINNNINFLLAHPSRNAGFQHALLQIDVDELAVVTQAVTDLTPPPPTTPASGGHPVIA